MHSVWKSPKKSHSTLRANTKIEKSNETFLVVFKQFACFHGIGWWFDIGKIAGWDIFHSFPSYLSLDIFLIPRVIWENPGKAAIKTLSQRSIFYPKIPRKKSSGFFISGDENEQKKLFWILWQKKGLLAQCVTRFGLLQRRSIILCHEILFSSQTF